MAKLEEVLRAFPLFRGIDPAELEALPSERVERGAGEAFFTQGERPVAAYGVITGRVRIAKQAPTGRELCLELLGPGDLVAAVAVLRDIPLPATGVAVERTALLQIPAAAFRGLLAKHPELAGKMLDVISRRLVEAGSSRLALATDPAEKRVAQALLRLAERYGSFRGAEVLFSQPITRQTLADLAGTTVETTIRVMSRWSRAGLVTSRASRITISRPDELRRIAAACS